MQGRIISSLGLAAAAAMALAACSKPAPPAPIPTNDATANIAPAPTTPTAPAPTPPAQTTGDAADVTAFLGGIYAHYKTNNSEDSHWAPMDSKDVLDPSLLALMKADEKAMKGEVGEIDSDWFCDCQDWNSITATVTVTGATPTTAHAVAVIQDSGGDPPGHDSFDLVKTAGGWRVDDMGTKNEPSLRAVLTKEIADVKSGKYKQDYGD